MEGLLCWREADWGGEHPIVQTHRNKSKEFLIMTVLSDANYKTNKTPIHWFH
jgi:hypothetical protein